MVRMSDNGVVAISKNPGEITLKGFTFMKDKLPNDFEVCLIVENSGHLSAACWYPGLWSTEGGKPGSFRQSRGGIISPEYVLAWLPIEHTSIEKNIWWDPDYKLIAEFWECLRVFAKNGDPILIFEYTSGAEERVLFHMDVKTGEIVESKETGYEDVKMIVSVLGKWYKAFKGELLEGFTTRNYKTLSNNGDL